MNLPPGHSPRPLTAPDPLSAALTALKAALTACRLAAFTGVVWVTWCDGAAGVTWEGAAVYTSRPPNWGHAHSTVLAAVRMWGPLSGARVVVQLRGGVPVGTHLDTPASPAL